MKIFTAVLLLLVAFEGLAQDTVFISQDLYLVPLTPNSYVHVSTLPTQDYGKVACNGLLYQVGQQVILADTPATLASTEALLTWLDKQNLELKGVLVNHYHNDCLAGLPAIHSRGINSYSHLKTPALALQENYEAPRITFSDSLVIHIGEQKVVAAFLGAGHSPDNSVVYLPQDKLLFGGCLVKSVDASKGYLGAADVLHWSKTVQHVKDRFNPQIVIPGHGQAGGTELLDYTIELFKTP
jgi:metallo-beta-lactamase class B